MSGFFQTKKILRTFRIERAPLEYTPASTSTVNFDRLNLQDPRLFYLALRFHQKPPSAKEQAAFARSLLWLIVTTALLVYAPPVLHVTFGPAFTLLAFGALPTLSALWETFRGSPGQQRASMFAVGGWLTVAYAFAVQWLDQRQSLFGLTPMYQGVGLSWPLAHFMLAFVVYFLVRYYLAHVLYVRTDPTSKAMSFVPTWLRYPKIVNFLTGHRMFRDQVGLSGLSDPVIAFAAAVVAFMLGYLSVDTPEQGLIVYSIVVALSAWFGFTHFARMAYVHLTFDVLHGGPGSWSPYLGRREAAVIHRRWRLCALLLGFHLAVATATHWGVLVLPASVRNISTESMFDVVRILAPPIQVTTGGALDYESLAWSASGAVLCIAVGAFISSFAFYGFAGLWMLPFRAIEKHYLKESTGKSEEAWQEYVGRLRTSPLSVVGPDGEEIRERDHFFLGYEPTVEFPVLLHRPLLSEHCYILGDTGSGKTSLGVIPLLTQILDRNQFLEPVDQAAVVILDLKGDMALLETARGGAAPFPGRFRYFTPEPTWSHVFNPFSELRDATSQSKIQIAQLFLEALALNHGEGYGRSYYSKRSRDLMLHAIEQSNATNFDELYDFLNRATKKDGKRFQEAFELVATIRALTYYRQLITSPDQQIAPESLIKMSSVLEQRQTIYFWLPSAIESVSVREIGKLALYSLVSQALVRRAAGLPTVQTYLFIDEFQRIAGENFKVILQQARSLGISVILANQSLADLRSPSADLRSTVRTNTRVKMYFSVQDRMEVDDLSQSSGLDVVIRETFSSGETQPAGFIPRGTRTEGKTTSHAEKPRLTPADIRAISDHPRRFVLHVSRGSGLSQFAGRAFPVETMFTTSREEYARRSNALWPQETGAISFAQGLKPAKIDERAAQEVQALEDIIDEQFAGSLEDEGLGGLTGSEQRSAKRSAQEETEEV